MGSNPYRHLYKTGQKNLSYINGGGGGIRTHGTLARTTVFETAPIDHSGTPPGSVDKLSQKLIPRVQFLLKAEREMITVGHGACMVEFGRHNRLKICRPKDVPVRVRLQAPLFID